ncbi:2-phospho-L-lactate guanylyltransferase [Catenulispora sp. NF23]|uniref:Phosphoenolpyruvate guanylyltransferase n=1 Tax=Catenulispora pinistramenti TaxID=2705254 RepID=A0ABS5KLW4_9ACTN|nr:2-phospho-L-lactate guanylyltransferase [Catenulispora pinistramenti]MBS2531446.1 2-phospho-L-lactate guanylyltransferase [Catenulispora pinistramenti]MBS2547016.1 2-phospho-L-lactate guanylyltransferase [Catenulispora pinistramenti]
MPRSDLFEPGAGDTGRTTGNTDWCLVVPVKRLGLAKTRLAGPGVPPALRERLALAFATDTVNAAFSASGVADVLVVTDDPQAAEVLGEIGATIVPDTPDAGLNAAFMFGAAAARRKLGTDIGIAACTADLPALRAAELDIALAHIAEGVRSFVADAHDIGTTMLFAPPGVELDPRFGGPSRAAHAASGALELAGARFGQGIQIASLRRDVDTATDLADALLLGVGPRTTEVWSARERVCSGV